MKFTLARGARCAGYAGSIVVAVLSVASCGADREDAKMTQVKGVTTLTVETARPVARAAQILTDAFGDLITYEDPRYAYAGDLEDYTDRVRKDLDRFPKGTAPRVIGPRSGLLKVKTSSKKLDEILAEVIEAQSSRGSGGRFRVERAGEVFHVIPTHSRDRNGNWVAQPSVLDVRISIPEGEWPAYELVDEIRRATASAARVTMTMGTNDLRPSLMSETATGEVMEPRKYQFEATNEPARSVLMRALTTISVDRGRMTWMLYFGNEATENTYVLNFVPMKEAPPFIRPAVEPISHPSDVSDASVVPNAR